MGQLSSTTVNTVKTIQGDVVAQVSQLSQLCNTALCSYDEFLIQMQELNSLANRGLGHSGKRLTIGVKRGTAEKAVLWRATVRIGVVLWDESSNTIISNRLLTLPQFLRVSCSIKQQLAAADRTDQPSSSQSNTGLGVMKKDLTLSCLFDEVDALTSADSLTECCICLERKPDVMLPCAHAYCLPCIEQWNTNHKTCPICREIVETTEDAWVLSDAPDSYDVQQEICSNLLQLSREAM